MTFRVLTGASLCWLGGAISGATDGMITYAFAVGLFMVGVAIISTVERKR